MKNIEIVRYQQRLDALFEKGKDISDLELQSHWARYLCILVSGYLETSVRAIYGEYTSKRADENVANYVSSRLGSFQSPKMGNILELTRAFSRQWAEELENATEGELKESVDSIVANRHNIAHGRDVGISYVTIREYYQNAVKVVELIEDQCS
jgi:hypothetical protein